MHDGRFHTLEEVVEHYSNGVKPSSTLDPNLAKHPINGISLSAADQKALVAFLKTLTDVSLRQGNKLKSLGATIEPQREEPAARNWSRAKPESGAACPVEVGGLQLARLGSFYWKT